jgi:hypothetical protein
LQKEHADEIRAGAERMTTINPPPSNEPDPNGVVDYTSGWEEDGGAGEEGGVRMLSLEDLASDPDVETPDVLSDSKFDIDSLPDGRTAAGDPTLNVTRPEEPQPMRPGSPRPVLDDDLPEPGTVRPGTPKGGLKTAIIEQPTAQVARPKFKVLRVNEDLEDVTIGKGRNLTFKTGVYYKVEPDVYEHLNEKGFVYH